MMEINKENFDYVMNFQRVSNFIKKYNSDGAGGIARQFISGIKNKNTTPEEVVKKMLENKAKHEKIITNNYEEALHVARYYIAYNKLNQSDKKFITKNRHKYLGESGAKNSYEKNIQKAIENYLKVNKILYIKNSNATRLVGEESYISIQSKKGSPDLIVFMKNANNNGLRTIGLEVKTEKGKQSPAQIKWQENFKNLGGEYYLVRNIDDVINIIA